jgi:hypothetical protein
MTVQAVNDPNTPIGEILMAAGSEGVLLESAHLGRFALIPLDDDLVDTFSSEAQSSAPIAARFAGAWTPASSRRTTRLSGNWLGDDEHAVTLPVAERVDR